MVILFLFFSASAAFHVPSPRHTCLASVPRNTAARVVAASPFAPIALRSSKEDTEVEKKLPWFVDPGTYGGVIVLTILGLTVPFVVYAGLIATGLDPEQTGVAMSGILVVGSIILWTFSYVFRVFSKNMTYGEQLRRYEDAVIQKRFEELQEDEVEALLSEIEREEGGVTSN